MSSIDTEDQIAPPEPQPVAEPIAKLLMEITDDAPNLEALMIGFVRKDGAASVRYTPMSCSRLNDLARMVEVKVMREYVQMLSPPPISHAPVRGAVRVHGPAPTRQDLKARAAKQESAQTAENPGAEKPATEKAIAEKRAARKPAGKRTRGRGPHQ